jgi:type IV secretory pathway TrbF-like protein
MVKEKFRLKQLHAVRGWRGRIGRVYDASQAWIIVSAVGKSLES